MAAKLFNMKAVVHYKLSLRNKKLIKWRHIQYMKKKWILWILSRIIFFSNFRNFRLRFINKKYLSLFKVMNEKLQTWMLFSYFRPVQLNGVLLYIIHCHCNGNLLKVYQKFTSCLSCRCGTCIPLLDLVSVRRQGPSTIIIAISDQIFFWSCCFFQ